MSTSGYVDTNRLSMYYEEAGQGRPLVLLHGAFSGTQSSFGAYKIGVEQADFLG